MFSVVPVGIKFYNQQESRIKRASEAWESGCRHGSPRRERKSKGKRSKAEWRTNGLPLRSYLLPFTFFLLTLLRTARVRCCPVNHTAPSSQNHAVAIIPARYASTRLPGKPLLEIAGRPMILHVVERALAARNVARAIVATDDRQGAGRRRGRRLRGRDDARGPRERQRPAGRSRRRAGRRGRDRQPARRRAARSRRGRSSARSTEFLHTTGRRRSSPRPSRSRTRRTC